MTPADCTGRPDRRPCTRCEDGSVSPAYCSDEDFQPCPECWGSRTVPGEEQAWDLLGEMRVRFTLSPDDDKANQ